MRKFSTQSIAGVDNFPGNRDTTNSLGQTMSSDHSNETTKGSIMTTASILLNPEQIQDPGKLRNAFKKKSRP